MASSHMNNWPSSRQSNKPKYSINLHGSIRNATIAAAWTTYAGTKALVRMGEYVKLHPESQGHDSAFEEECYARDALAEFLAAQKQVDHRTDAYLHLLADVRDAGFIREYVWRFVREPAWPQPDGLKTEAFDAWCVGKGLSEHRPLTLAFISAG